MTLAHMTMVQSSARNEVSHVLDKTIMKQLLQFHSYGATVGLKKRCRSKLIDITFHKT